MRRFQLFASVLAFAACAGEASAAIVVPAGFSVTEFAIGPQVDGLAFGPGGAYGTDLYAAAGAAVLRVNPSTGAFTTFATGLATAGNRHSGLAFDPGTFGTGLLYVVQNNGTVKTVSSSGVVGHLVGGGSLFSSNDLAFAPSGSAFGNNLFVSNGGFASASVTISKVTSAGVDSVFASAFPEVPIGLAFGPSGSAFGSNLFASLGNGTVVQVNSLGNVTSFASGMGRAIDLTFSAGGAFGEYIYVSDPITQTILRVNSSGVVSVFATGFSFESVGFDADLLFSPDGNSLFIANDQSLVRISAVPEPASAILFGFGVLSVLGCNCVVRSNSRPRA